jgi:hypothetical protein
MLKLPEWITAIGTIGTAGGVLFLWKQLNLMRKEIDADHDRSRRENSINYLFEWSKGLLRSSSLARRLVEELNDDQTKALADEHELTIDKKYKDLVLGVLSVVPKDGLNESDRGIILYRSQVADIRWQVVRYLNILESVFVAARHGVANREILVEQFNYLYDKGKRHYVLKKFREVLGGAEAYPALDELETSLREKHTPTEGLKPIRTSASRQH